MRRLRRFRPGLPPRRVGSIALEIREDGRALQCTAWSGLIGCNGAAPGGGVFLIEQIDGREAGEVGIAEELRSIIERASLRLGNQMDGFRRVAPRASEVKTLENIQRL